MTSKGQITVPVEVRARLGLTAGARVEFIEHESGYLISAKPLRGADLAGLLPRPAVPVPLEQMERDIADSAVEAAGL
jgi:AbrB family looped-hinge helix DNA binding protein